MELSDLKVIRNELEYVKEHKKEADKVVKHIEYAITYLNSMISKPNGKKWIYIFLGFFFSILGYIIGKVW